MATEVLAPALTEAFSTVITIADGTRATFFLTGPAAQATSMTGALAILMQSSTGAMSVAYQMDSDRRTARVDGPAAIQFRRFARDSSSLALGVDRA